MTLRTDSPFLIAASALARPYAALTEIVRFLASPFSAIVRSYRMRRTASELYGLDARTLRDIGIERASIDLIARASVDHPSTDPRHSSFWR